MAFINKLPLIEAFRHRRFEEGYGPFFRDVR